ncbi:MAG TPA: 5'-3' exonuclease H3TH domain-containing protein [Chloroflexota bacterium]|nr:5'-3' exonuclease H3TH domain-containing protein [Chloroflexota bacterium]
MTILLLDGHNLLFRSFTTLPDSIIDASGRPINAVYGLVATIIRYVREREPEHIVAAFDIPEIPTFRHKLFPNYQAQRGPLGGDRADDFANQVQVAREVLPHFGIPALTAPGFEADDIMGTLAIRMAEAGKDATIVTTDRDALQLVRPHVAILVPGKEARELASVDDVVARMGVRPEGIVPFKALAGDSSDNIPGLPGIGSKTAAQLVNDYGTLDGIYEHLDAISPRARRSLEDNRADALLFERLVTIQTGLDLAVKPESLPPVAVSDADSIRDILARAGHPMAERKA